MLRFREVDDLLAAAERSADRAANHARILVSLVLLITVFIVGEDIPDSDPVIVAQIAAAKITLGAWLAVGLVAALLTRIGYAPTLLRYAVVTLDIGLLGCNLYYGLASSGLAGNFWSIFPVAWILPVAMVSTALRWNPRVAAYAGALILAILTAIAVGQGHVEEAERIEQLSRVPLIFGWPPNIVRLIMIALAIVLVVAVTWRGRSLILQAANETARRMTLGRHLPRQILPLILDPALASIRDGSKRQLAIMFVDIRGATQLAEQMEPASLARLIVDFRRIVDQAVEAHGGVIDKFIGDGALALFGVLPSDRNMAADAIACGRDLLARIEAFNADRATAGLAPVAVGIAVHAGPVFVGVVGHDDRVEFTALGEAVNIAARLEKATKLHACRLLVSGDALSSSGLDSAPFRPVGAITLEGVSRPQAAFALA